MNFVKLLNFELQRFMKFFFGLAAVIAIMQIAGAIYSAKSYVKYSEDAIKREQLELADFLMNYGPYTMSNYLNTGFFLFSVMLGMVVVFIYIFFIWYRDWLGKSAFMYRLLMLPSTRLHIYTSKLAAILLITLGLTGLQVLLIAASEVIIQSIIPAQWFVDENVVYLYSYPLLSLLFPHTLVEGLLIYSIGIALVTVTFTGILLERSFGIRGIIIAIVYGIVAAAALITPTILLDVLYTDELHMIVTAIACALIVISTLLSHYLLKRKITV